MVSVLSKNCVMKHLKVKDGMNECSWGSQDHKGQHWGEGLREPVACPLCERRGSLGLKSWCLGSRMPGEWQTSLGPGFCLPVLVECLNPYPAMEAGLLCVAV